MKPTTAQRLTLLEANFADVLSGVRQVLEIQDQFRQAIDDERTHRLKLAQEQRWYVDGETRRLRDTCQERWDSQARTFHIVFENIGEFRRLTFWQRVHWLFTGRLPSDAIS